jgi:hypothetical protein
VTIVADDVELAHLGAAADPLRLALLQTESGWFRAVAASDRQGCTRSQLRTAAEALAAAGLLERRSITNERGLRTTEWRVNRAGIAAVNAIAVALGHPPPPSEARAGFVAFVADSALPAFTSAPDLVFDLHERTTNASARGARPVAVVHVGRVNDAKD